MHTRFIYFNLISLTYISLLVTLSAKALELQEGAEKIKLRLVNPNE